MNFLLLTLLISLGINICMFFVAYRLRTDMFTDISYAITFLVLAYGGLHYADYTVVATIVFFMIVAWAVRLGAFLLIRIRRIGRDKRFDGMRERFWAFLKFWVLQGISVWVILLPSLQLFMSVSSSHNTMMLTIGFLIWLCGLSIETIADIQKYRFNQDPNNRGRWIETGLWKYSRHPNYFGEILVWIGVYIYTLAIIPFPYALIGLLGPLYISVLIIFVSGIPLLEKSATQKWGMDVAYQRYKQTTSVLVLLPKKAIRAPQQNI